MPVCRAIPACRATQVRRATPVPRAIQVRRATLARPASRARLARLVLGSAGPIGPTGAQGTAGNTVLSGSIAPTSGVGQNGDFYIATSTSTLYGPKAGGNWPAGVALKGTNGTNGISISFGDSDESHSSFATSTTTVLESAAFTVPATGGFVVANASLMLVNDSTSSSRTATCRFYSGANSASLSGAGATWSYSIPKISTVVLPMTARWGPGAGSRVVAVRCSSSSSQGIELQTGSLSGVLTDK